jgi:hypothetical protein
MPEPNAEMELFAAEHIIARLVARSNLSDHPDLYTAETKEQATRHRIPRQTTAAGVTNIARTVHLNNWIKQCWVLKWLVKVPKSQRKPE